MIVANIHCHHPRPWLPPGRASIVRALSVARSDIKESLINSFTPLFRLRERGLSFLTASINQSLLKSFRNYPASPPANAGGEE